MNTLKLSGLPKTWIIDLDGTIFPHNGYLENKNEFPLPGVSYLFNKISRDDFIIILTSRSSKYREQTEFSLRKAELRYDLLLMDMPKGERVLINDTKPSGLITAHSVNVMRDQGLLDLDLKEDAKL